MDFYILAAAWLGHAHDTNPAASMYREADATAPVLGRLLVFLALLGLFLAGLSLAGER